MEHRTQPCIQRTSVYETQYTDPSSTNFSVRNTESGIKKTWCLVHRNHKAIRDGLYVVPGRDSGLFISEECGSDLPFSDVFRDSRGDFAVVGVSSYLRVPFSVWQEGRKELGF